MTHEPKQLLLAHRGYCAIAPENTRLSFDCALLFGFDGIELDVHLTLDGEVVVIHDETTDRTTLSSATIATSTLAQLQKLDYGAFFKQSVPFQTLMTLDDFLVAYLNVPSFQVINIEIKTDITHYHGIETKIHQIAAKYPQAYQKIIFSSFNFESLKILHQLDRRWKLGFLFWTKTQLQAVDPKQLQQICHYLHPWTDLYDQLRTEILALQKPICLWTIKSQKMFDKYRSDPYVVAQIANYQFRK